MSLNWKEIDLILSELSLEESHIQKVQQPDFHTLLLELYHPLPGRYTLCISLSQRGCRINRLYSPMPKSTKKLQRFMQLLRSHIIGGKITRAVQVHRDRIIQLTIRRGESICYLYARLWGGASNIILCDDEHRILDAYYRRPGKLEQSGEYFSPEDEPEAPPRDEFSIRFRKEGITFNEQIDLEYRTTETEDLRDSLSAQVRSILDDKEAGLISRLSGLDTQQNQQNEERTRELADLLAANIHRIRPGESTAAVEDFFHDNSPVEIPLDPRLPAGEQAEVYYRRYQKERRTREHREEDLANVQRQLADISEQRNHLLVQWEDREAHIASLRQFLSTESGPTAETLKGERPPGLQFRSGPFLILVGRTAKENDRLLRKFTKGNDYWLHARDYPGGYVFIKHIKGKTVPLETLLDAGHLALHFSKARRSGKGDLYYTQVKYLRRAKHGKLGTVIPTQEKNIFVETDPDRIRRLLGGDS